MYLKLIFMFLLFLAWGHGVKAVVIPDTQRSSQESSASASRLLEEKPRFLARANATYFPMRPENRPDVITLETNVVQIILNDEHRGGVDWGAIVSDFHTAPLKKANDPDWNDKKYRLSFGTVSQDDYAVLLDALDTVGRMSQFRQAPIKAASGTPAGIDFEKQNIHVDFLLSRSKSGDLFLRIEPHLAVDAEELLHSEAKVLIADNTTIVIGGFMKEEEITRTRKFPLLGDIPIVGLVFRRQGRLMQKTETVIFLTVRTNAVDAPEEDNSS